MEVYLKKISQTPIGFSENELKEFTNGLSSNETICLQYLTAKNPTGVSVSSFNQSFNNYVNDFLMKDVNILLIYKIKLNYLIINAIKAEPNQYSFMQVNSIKIDTENLSESENALITNPSVLKTAYALYLRIIPKSKDKTKQDDKDDVNDKFALGTRRNYVRVFEDLDKQKGISIFSSFKKASTAEIIDNISSLINNKSDEIVNSINSVYHHALSASLKQYKVFFDN
ncbi:hypothetical protein J6W20_00220 [bacterium]|nr:hypothetical protein [bacterium]